VRLLPLPPKLYTRTCWNLSQFWTPLWRKIVKGTPIHNGGAPVRLGHSPAHVKIWGCSTLRRQNLVFWKNRFGWVWFDLQMSVVTGPMFTRLFRLMWEELRSIRYLSNFEFSSSVLEIFAVEVLSHPKLCQILHIFGPQNFGPGLFNWSANGAQRSCNVKK